jgi:nucleoside-diphosphate-sugar epimerase
MAEPSFVTGGSGFIGSRLIERLVAEGRPVRALARSDVAAAKVEALGAEAVRGELGDRGSLIAGAAGCATAFHLAAHLGEWGPWEDFERGNVEGTRNALAACEEAGVRRFVHCGTEAALMAGEPLVHVDESAPLRPDSPAPYPATKAKAELAVREASRDGFETVAVRPRFVWGKGDTTLLPEMVKTVEAGRFAWVGGGRNVTDTAHVDNVVEGLVLGAEKGRAGRGLLHHRRRAGRLPRVRHRDAADPGGRAARPQPARLDRGAAGPCLRAGLEAAVPGRAADDQVPLLDPHPGVHDRDRQGP